MPTDFRVRRTDKGVLRVERDLAVGEECFALLSSDRHHDNAHVDHQLERWHLEEARDRNACWWDNGDWFCAMQGRFDKRASHEATPPELERDDYADQLIRTHAEFYEEWADLLVGAAMGNHEDSFNKRCQTNLTKRLIRELKDRDARCQAEDMPMQGWVHFDCGSAGLKKMRFTHGYGGGGPVTKDTIQANRQLVYTEGADLLLSGHTHDAWYMPVRRHHTTDEGKVNYSLCHVIKCPGYKDEFDPGVGFAALKGHPPKPLAAWWVRLYNDPRRGLRLQVTLAD